jgi:hypothetical protein
MPGSLRERPRCSLLVILTGCATVEAPNLSWSHKNYKVGNRKADSLPCYVAKIFVQRLLFRLLLLLLLLLFRLALPFTERAPAVFSLPLLLVTTPVFDETLLRFALAGMFAFVSTAP